MAASVLTPATDPFIDPIVLIESEDPDVWLTSFYGFAPRNWGFLGFSDPRMLTRFRRESRPGALVVVYAAPKAPPDERGLLLGIQQVGARTGEARDFMTPDAWQAKQANPDQRDKWNHAVQAIRAWSITPETRMPVGAFAPDSYWPDRARFIGAWGVRLTPSEARRILDLDLVEVEVFGGLGALDGLPGSARKVLEPSRAGPVSQSGFTTKEAEGPKHLYILRLNGKAENLLEYDCADKWIVKVGFSHSPATRCDAHNKALPACAFEWDVEYSTFAEGREPFPSSGHAKAGEQIMKDLLAATESSLGGEFFLAGKKSIQHAWQRAIKAAESWRP